MAWMRSDSFTRSSPAPVTRVRPSAQAAATANTGNSSIMSATSASGRSMPCSGACRTSMSATGPQTPSRRPVSRMSAPIMRSASSSPVRRGSTPTERSRSDDPGTRVAATMKNAAEEKSPGTSMSRACRRCPPDNRASPGANATGQPKAASMRSV